MIRGEEFEKECYEYLKEKYQDFDGWWNGFYKV